MSVTFAFICMDGNETKRLVVEKLEALNVPFVDTGMGLDLGGDSLGRYCEGHREHAGEA